MRFKELNEEATIDLMYDDFLDGKELEAHYGVRDIKTFKQFLFRTHKLEVNIGEETKKFKPDNLEYTISGIKFHYNKTDGLWHMLKTKESDKIIIGKEEPVNEIKTGLIYMIGSKKVIIRITKT